MIYELEDTSKVVSLFEGWEETLIYSCLQKVMGKVYVTDLQSPVSAMAFVGCFAFYAGEPDRELVSGKPAGFVIMVPQNSAWSSLIEECFPDARKVTRYAIRKDTVFDRDKLVEMIKALPAGYELKKIDSDLYDLCLLDPVTTDFVSAFGSKERYLELGRGMVILKDGKIVSGASSFLSRLADTTFSLLPASSSRYKALTDSTAFSVSLWAHKPVSIVPIVNTTTNKMLPTIAIVTVLLLLVRFIEDLPGI